MKDPSFQLTQLKVINICRKYLFFIITYYKYIFIFLFLENMMIVERFKLKVISIIKKLTNESQSRVQKTKKVKLTWREMLFNLESKDTFKLDFSIPEEILLKKVLVRADVKCNIKSNVKFNKINNLLFSLIIIIHFFK